MAPIYQSQQTHVYPNNGVQKESPAVDLKPDSYHSDEEDDSFDVTSLLPSTSNPFSHPGLTEPASFEQTGDLHTFLHTNQDHTRHLRQLNDLIPSPLPAASHPERVSQNTTNSFKNSSVVSSWRVQISNDGLPATLHEETSEELRRSELSSNLIPTDKDSLDLSEDEDGCSTVHAPRDDTTQASHSIIITTPCNGFQVNPGSDECTTNCEPTTCEASEEPLELPHQHRALPPPDFRSLLDHRHRPLPPPEPNKSFGFEFSSPIAIKDLSIHHPPSPDADTPIKKTGPNLGTPENCTKVDANQAELTQESQYLPRNTCSIEDGSLFGPHASQIPPLPHFTPLRVPEPRMSPSHYQSPLSKREESPLMARATKHSTGAGRVHFLPQSILRPRTSQDPRNPTWLQSSQPSKRDSILSGYVQSQSPDRLKCLPLRVLGPHLDTSKSPSAANPSNPHFSAMADDSVYLTPDASLSMDDQQHLVDDNANTKTPNDQIHARMPQSHDNLSSAWEANLLSRYRTLVSLAENLKQDLSIKNQVIQVLTNDRDEAFKNRDEADEKIKEMTDQLHEAIIQQKVKQDQQAQRIASIVENLTCDIENMMAKCDMNMADEKNGVSPDDFQQFQTQLQSSKVAMEKIQLLPQAPQNPISVLETRNSQQAVKIEADSKEIAMLRQQIVQLQDQVAHGTQVPATETSTTARSTPASNNGLANDLDQPHNASVVQSPEDPKTCCQESQVAYDCEVSRMKVEIESLSKQLATMTVKDQDLQDVKENVRMLEEEATSRMQAMAEFRSQAHSLQHELKTTKKSLQAAEDGQAESLEHIKQLQHKLDSITRDHLSELQANMDKLTQSQHEYNADRSELMSKLKTSHQESERLRVELVRLKSRPCQACEDKEIRATVLEQEQHSVQKKFDECRVKLAAQEAQIAGLNKHCKALEHDILGLNIALQAKQQENSYVRLDLSFKDVYLFSSQCSFFAKLKRQAGLTSSSLATSTKTPSNRTGSLVASRETSSAGGEGTIRRNEERKLSQEGSQPIVTRKSRRTESRGMLSSITNLSSSRIDRPNTTSSESISLTLTNKGPRDPTLGCSSETPSKLFSHPEILLLLRHPLFPFQTLTHYQYQPIPQ
ncbi:hypothetical protein VP01_531g6 [Puccinia sorghi]|uniref:Uncharacterized protein n=1 Tax=Puccinia sorghi TaxID=27349 RepID=A0A0L6UM67_9BASI|nr:hypothetical protein VP01_531g6 [Puccinia sorghi]